MFIDLHIHSTASDGTDSPEEIVEKIGRHSGVKIFALTDHDTIVGIEKLPATFSDTILFINGVEFSCKIADRSKCHILAYFFDAANEAFQQLLSKGNVNFVSSKFGLDKENLYKAKRLKNRMEFQFGHIRLAEKENLYFQMRYSNLDFMSFATWEYKVWNVFTPDTQINKKIS